MKSHHELTVTIIGTKTDGISCSANRVRYEYGTLKPPSHLNHVTLKPTSHLNHMHEYGTLKPTSHVNHMHDYGTQNPNFHLRPSHSVSLHALNVSSVVYSAITCVFGPICALILALIHSTNHVAVGLVWFIRHYAAVALVH